MIFERPWLRVSALSQRYKKNLLAISFLGAATMAGAVLGFITQILVARSLGVTQYGLFSSTLAMVSLLSPLAGFGVAGYWLNAFGREGWVGLRWLPGSFKFLRISTTIVMILVFSWAWFGPHEREVSWLLTILSVHILGMAAIELTGAKCQLEGRPGKLAAVQFTPHLLRLIGVGAVVILLGSANISAAHVAVVFAVVAVIVLIRGLVNLSQMAHGRLILEGHARAEEQVSSPDSKEQPGPLKVLSFSWPFGMAGVLYLIYFQSDIILIKYMVGEAQAGVYGAAFVVISAIYLMPSVVYQKYMLPKFHRWAHYDQARLRQMYRVGNFVMLGMGIAAMLTVWLLGPYFVPWLFGVEYSGTIEIVLILSLAIPFRFVANSAGSILATRNHMRIKVRLMAVGAVCNLLLNFAVIPIAGAKGAAATTVLTEALIMSLYLIYNMRIVGERGRVN